MDESIKLVWWIYRTQDTAREEGVAKKKNRSKMLYMPSQYPSI